MEDILERATERVKEETHPFDGKVITTSNQCNDIPGGNTSLFESSSGITAESSLYCTSHKSAKSIVSVNPQGDHIFESEGKVMHSNLYEEQSGIPVKNDGQINSTFPTSVKVKDEPLDNGNFHNVQANGVGNFSFNIKNVKSEWEAQNKNYDDQVEDMCLRDRLKIFMAGEGFNLNSSRNYPYSKKTRPSSFGRSSVLSESPEPISIKCPRKRKKTATYCIVRLNGLYNVRFTSINVYLICYIILQGLCSNSVGGGRSWPFASTVFLFICYHSEIGFYIKLEGNVLL